MMREEFEEWFTAQFPTSAKEKLKYHIELGYLDNLVNAMWIGFNAHAKLNGYE